MRKRTTKDEALLQMKADRRLLSHVPDPEQIRKNADRRGTSAEEDERRPQFAHFPGQRYQVSFAVTLKRDKLPTLKGECVDISQTGLLLRLPDNAGALGLRVGDECTLKFSLLPGTLHEGMEKHYRMKSKVVRRMDNGEFGLQFNEPIYRNLKRTRGNVLFSLAALLMFLVSLAIILMRTESVVYFRANSALYMYSIITAAFLLTRYLFGALYRPFKVEQGFTPAVTVVIPCFNEETYIRRTILSCIDQDYPPDKLQIIIVDDGSSDRSVEVIQQTVASLWQEHERFMTKSRIRVFLQKKNQGKREAMALGIRNTHTELVAFVDSDSFLEPNAIRELVQPFIDPKMAGSTGRTDVANAYTNSLTKMQTVRYYISFRFIKAAEAYFDSVMCLSGPLSCYRTSVVNEVLDKWVNQTFLGQRATFGDDRSLTNYLVKNHRTYYQDTAICSTIVPSNHKTFLKQQMRWKRSWLRESLRAASFMWKKEPLMVLSFYFGLIIPMIAPLIVVYNLIIIPITQHIFPTTFIVGILLMSLMMSFAQLLMKRSRLWIYGIYFCLYYELVLLWQMPWAWFTFWVSNWGTRGTAKKKTDSAQHGSAEQARAAQRKSRAQRAQAKKDDTQAKHAKARQMLSHKGNASAAQSGQKAANGEG